VSHADVIDDVGINNKMNSRKTFLTLPPCNCTVPAQRHLVALDTIIVLAYLLTLYRNGAELFYFLDNLEEYSSTLVSNVL